MLDGLESMVLTIEPSRPEKSSNDETPGELPEVSLPAPEKEAIFQWVPAMIVAQKQTPEGVKGADAHPSGVTL